MKHNELKNIMETNELKNIMETNEQKAKAYDAVLERAKDMYAHTGNGYAKQIMEQIFPELKESKSERIRREMIEFLKKQRQQTFVPYEWTDWLKEQKEFVSADFDEVWDTLDTGWNAQINGISKDVLRAVCQKWFSKGVDIERKSAKNKFDWSEEDETTIKNLVWALSNDHLKDREEFCEWLNALNDRMKKIN